MAGLVPAIHELTPRSAQMDARNECGHDDWGVAAGFPPAIEGAGAGGG